MDNLDWSRDWKLSQEHLKSSNHHKSCINLQFGRGEQEEEARIRSSSVNSRSKVIIKIFNEFGEEVEDPFKNNNLYDSTVDM